jgi:alcohol dehydrogenase (cytochrome c)
VSTPILMPVRRDGRVIPALVHPARNGYLWVLEREADRISFVDAEPYVYQDVFTSIDVETGRPTYDEAHRPGTGRRTEFCPSLWGGKDWPPAAYNPETGLVYIPANDNLCGAIVGREVVYQPGSAFTGASTELMVRDLSRPIGEIQAWDMNTGQEVWTHEFDGANWGPVLTTGGGLVFAGGTSDRYFRAFDARTGAVLWEQRTNSGVIGVPSTFAVDGVQYVAVQSGWGVDAQGMTGRIDRARGTETIVPQGGVVWVFALRR